MNKMQNSQYPLVSIVTPAFNQCEYLDETIKSVLAQTYPNIEYIVIDDGSTDQTWTILQKWNDRVHCLTHSNMGQAATLNKGWQMARGEVLGYLSSDDLLNPTAVERLMLAYKRSNAIIFGRYNLIDQDGKVLQSKRINFDGYEEMVHAFNCPIGPGALFSATLFREFGGWNPVLKQIPDYDFWIRAGLHAQFTFVDEELASFRVHTGSQTFARSSMQKADESFASISSLFAVANPRQLKRQKAMASAYVFSSCLHLRSGRPWTALKRLASGVANGGFYFLSIVNVKRLLGTIYAIFKYRKIK